MIIGLKGKIKKIEPARLHIDTGNVVYEVLISFRTFDFFKDKLKEEIYLYIYHSITDRYQRLFGFVEENDRSLFELLKSLSGIGELTALRVLSFFNAAELLEVVQKNDTKRLEKIPKVKGKTSEKILFEVKQNIKKFEVFLEENMEKERAPDQEFNLAIQALIQLGFDEKTATREVGKTTQAGFHSIPDIIREVLKSN